jgi:hypothetical protein
VFPTHTNCACACGTPTPAASTEPSAVAAKSVVRTRDDGNVLMNAPHLGPAVTTGLFAIWRHRLRARGYRSVAGAGVVGRGEQRSGQR